MKNRKLLITAAVAAVFVGLHAQTVQAANIAVTNVTLTSALYAGRVADVKFDVSWDASWRSSWTYTNNTPIIVTNSVTNWDATWIFVKYRCPAGGAANTNWNHASLSTNNSDHVAPAGSTINVGLSTNAAVTNFGAGVFLYRSTDNTSGSWTNTGVKLRWRFGDDGVASTAHVDVCVHAIEMVYVPQGSFWLGDGAKANIQGHFEDGISGQPFLVTNENYEITLGGGAVGSLGNSNTVGMVTTDDFNDVTVQILPAAFPKGFSAFYCMKYETSQRQYADFLNQLTNSTQATARYPNYYNSARYTISGSYPNYSASAPTRACNYLSWADAAAYADWAGLRPISELEFEKACRGPLYPVTNECAWGNTSGTCITNFTGGTDGSGTETATPINANWSGGSYINGPIRCGIFATTNSSRQDAGASYWGIMALSGGIGTRIVTVGNTTGRGFTGTHGDGKLTSGGNADAPSWPGTNGTGAGIHGGCYSMSLSYNNRVSSRTKVAFTNSERDSCWGWRAGRSAPVVNP